MLYIVVFFVVIELRWEVTVKVGFVDIGGIVDIHSFFS